MQPTYRSPQKRFPEIYSPLTASRLPAPTLDIPFRAAETAFKDDSITAQAFDASAYLFYRITDKNKVTKEQFEGSGYKDLGISWDPGMTVSELDARASDKIKETYRQTNLGASAKRHPFLTLGGSLVGGMVADLPLMFAAEFAAPAKVASTANAASKVGRFSQSIGRSVRTQTMEAMGESLVQDRLSRFTDDEHGANDFATNIIGGNIFGVAFGARNAFKEARMDGSGDAFTGALNAAAMMSTPDVEAELRSREFKAQQAAKNRESIDAIKERLRAKVTAEVDATIANQQQEKILRDHVQKARQDGIDALNAEIDITIPKSEPTSPDMSDVQAQFREQMIETALQHAAVQEMINGEIAAVYSARGSQSLVEAQKRITELQEEYNAIKQRKGYIESITSGEYAEANRGVGKVSRKHLAERGKGPVFHGSQIPDFYHIPDHTNLGLDDAMEYLRIKQEWEQYLQSIGSWKAIDSTSTFGQKALHAVEGGYKALSEVRTAAEAKTAIANSRKLLDEHLKTIPEFDGERATLARKLAASPGSAADFFAELAKSDTKFFGRAMDTLKEIGINPRTSRAVRAAFMQAMLGTDPNFDSLRTVLTDEYGLKIPELKVSEAHRKLLTDAAAEYNLTPKKEREGRLQDILEMYGLVNSEENRAAVANINTLLDDAPIFATTDTIPEITGVDINKLATDFTAALAEARLGKDSKISWTKYMEESVRNIDKISAHWIRTHSLQDLWAFFHANVVTKDGSRPNLLRPDAIDKAVELYGGSREDYMGMPVESVTLVTNLAKDLKVKWGDLLTGSLYTQAVGIHKEAHAPKAKALIEAVTPILREKSPLDTGIKEGDFTQRQLGVEEAFMAASRSAAEIEDPKIRAGAMVLQDLLGHVAVRFVPVDKADVLGMHGAASRSANVIYVKETDLIGKGAPDMLAIAGHELAHVIRMRQPGLWKQIVQELLAEAQKPDNDFMLNRMFQAYKSVDQKVREVTGHSPLIAREATAEVLDEVMATVFGEFLRHPSFWTEMKHVAHTKEAFVAFLTHVADKYPQHFDKWTYRAEDFPNGPDQKIGAKKTHIGAKRVAQLIAKYKKTGGPDAGNKFDSMHSTLGAYYGLGRMGSIYDQYINLQRRFPDMINAESRNSVFRSMHAVDVYDGNAVAFRMEDESSTPQNPSKYAITYRYKVGPNADSDISAAFKAGTTPVGLNRFIINTIIRGQALHWKRLKAAGTKLNDQQAKMLGLVTLHEQAKQVVAARDKQTGSSLDNLEALILQQGPLVQIERTAYGYDITVHPSDQHPRVHESRETVELTDEELLRVPVLGTASDTHVYQDLRSFCEQNDYTLTAMLEARLDEEAGASKEVKNPDDSEAAFEAAEQDKLLSYLANDANASTFLDMLTRDYPEDELRALIEEGDNEVLRDLLTQSVAKRYVDQTMTVNEFGELVGEDGKVQGEYAGAIDKAAGEVRRFLDDSEPKDPNSTKERRKLEREADKKLEEAQPTTAQLIAEAQKASLTSGNGNAGPAMTADQVIKAYYGADGKMPLVDNTKQGILGLRAMLIDNQLTAVTDYITSALEVEGNELVANASKSIDGYLQLFLDPDKQGELKSRVRNQLTANPEFMDLVSLKADEELIGSKRFPGYAEFAVAEHKYDSARAKHLLDLEDLIRGSRYGIEQQLRAGDSWKNVDPQEILRLRSAAAERMHDALKTAASAPAAPAPSKTPAKSGSPLVDDLIYRFDKETIEIERTLKLQKARIQSSFALGTHKGIRELSGFPWHLFPTEADGIAAAVADIDNELAARKLQQKGMEAGATRVAQLQSQGVYHLLSYLDGVARKGVPGEIVGNSVESRMYTRHSELAGEIAAICEANGLYKFFDTPESRVALAEQLLQAMEGNANVDPAVSSLAQAMYRASDTLRLQSNAVGGNTRELSNRLFRQIHDKERILGMTDEQYNARLAAAVDSAGPKGLRNELEAIRNEAFQEWADFITPRLDGARMGLKNEAAVKAYVSEWFDAIINAPDRETLVEDYMTDRNPKHRSVQFLDPKSFLEYDARFGSGDALPRFFSDLMRHSDETVLREAFGWNYREVFASAIGRYELKERLDKNGNKVRSWLPVIPTPKEVTAALGKGMGAVFSRKADPKAVAALTHATFLELTGYWNTPLNPGVHNWWASLRNLTRSARIMTAGLSGVLDWGNAASVLRQFGIRGATAKVVNGAVVNMASPEARKAAGVLGTNVGDFLRHVSKLTESRGSLYHATDKLSDFSMKVAGIDLVAQATRDAVTEQLTHHLAIADPKDPGLIQALDFVGMTEADLVELQKHAKALPGDDVMRIHPDLVPDPMLARKLRTALVSLSKYSVIEPPASIRAYMNAGTQSGTYFGEIVRSATMFKGFALGQLSKGVRRIDNWQGGTYGREKWVWACSMISLAMVAISLKNIAGGKEPINPLDREQWTFDNIAKVITQSGAGPFASIESLAANPAGPMFGPMVDLGIAIANADGYRTANSLYGFAPFSSTPMARTLFRESLSFVDEDYAQHYAAAIKYVEERTGQTQLTTQ